MLPAIVSRHSLNRASLSLRTVKQLPGDRRELKCVRSDPLGGARRRGEASVLDLSAVWKASDQPANANDTSSKFRFTGYTAAVRMETSGEAPGEGLS
jgi:hypothetical protein